MRFGVVRLESNRRAVFADRAVQIALVFERVA
jgi:hypothetical protein